MAVTDDAVNPSPPPPPPARTSVAVLALVPFVLAPMLALVRVAARALPYLGFATAWVCSVICAATAVAHLALGECSAPFVFLLALTVAAVKVCGTFLLVALLLCGRRLVEFVSGSGPEFKKSAFGAVIQESTQKSFRFPRAVVLGLVADLLFILLIVAGSLMEVMISSPAEGSISQGEMIGSVIADVGLFGIHAISCFVIPVVVLSVWRIDQANREEPSQCCGGKAKK